MSTPKKPHQTPGTAPANRLPLKARIGMKLINELITAGAAPERIAGAVAGTVIYMPHYLINSYLADMVRLGCISELTAQQCRQIYLEKHPTCPSLTIN